MESDLLDSYFFELQSPDDTGEEMMDDVTDVLPDPDLSRRLQGNLFRESSIRLLQSRSMSQPNSIVFPLEDPVQQMDKLDKRWNEIQTFCMESRAAATSSDLSTTSASELQATASEFTTSASELQATASELQATATGTQATATGSQATATGTQTSAKELQPTRSEFGTTCRLDVSTETDLVKQVRPDTISVVVNVRPSSVEWAILTFAVVMGVMRWWVDRQFDMDFVLY